MKKIFTLVGIVAAVGALATASFAQKPGPGGQGGQGGKFGGGQGGPGQGRMQGMRKMQEEILAKLNLTADQKSKIKALNDKFQKDIQALMKSGDPQSNRDKFRELSKNHRDAMMKILTPAQQTQYKKLIDEARKKFGGPGGPGGAGAGKGPGKGGGGKGGSGTGGG